MQPGLADINKHTKSNMDNREVQDIAPEICYLE